jgi:hypothetical protein
MIGVHVDASFRVMAFVAFVAFVASAFVATGSFRRQLAGGRGAVIVAVAVGMRGVVV